MIYFNVTCYLLLCKDNTTHVYFNENLSYCHIDFTMTENLVLFYLFPGTSNSSLVDRHCFSVIQCTQAKTKKTQNSLHLAKYRTRSQVKNEIRI